MIFLFLAFLSLLFIGIKDNRLEMMKRKINRKCRKLDSDKQRSHETHSYNTSPTAPANLCAVLSPVTDVHYALKYIR